MDAEMVEISESVVYLQKTLLNLHRLKNRLIRIHCLTDNILTSIFHHVLVWRQQLSQAHQREVYWQGFTVCSRWWSLFQRDRRLRGYLLWSRHFASNPAQAVAALQSSSPEPLHLRMDVAGLGRGVLPAIIGTQNRLVSLRLLELDYSSFGTLILGLEAAFFTALRKLSLITFGQESDPTDPNPVDYVHETFLARHAAQLDHLELRGDISVQPELLCNIRVLVITSFFYAGYDSVRPLDFFNFLAGLEHLTSLTLGSILGLTEGPPFINVNSTIYVRHHLKKLQVLKLVNGPCPIHMLLRTLSAPPKCAIMIICPTVTTVDGKLRVIFQDLSNLYRHIKAPAFSSIEVSTYRGDLGVSFDFPKESRGTCASEYNALFVGIPRHYSHQMQKRAITQISEGLCLASIKCLSLYSTKGLRLSLVKFVRKQTAHATVLRIPMNRLDTLDHLTMLLRHWRAYRGRCQECSFTHIHFDTLGSHPDIGRRHRLFISNLFRTLMETYAAGKTITISFTTLPSNLRNNPYHPLAFFTSTRRDESV